MDSHNFFLIVISLSDLLKNILFNYLKSRSDFLKHEKCMLVIGGDERYLSMIPLLIERVTEMYVIGFTEVEFNYEGLHQVSSLADVPFHKIDMIILPVSGSNLDGHITLSYPQGTCTLTKQMIQSTPNHCIIISGVGNSYLKDICIGVGRQLVAL